MMVLASVFRYLFALVLDIVDSVYNLLVGLFVGAQALSEEIT